MHGGNTKQHDDLLEENIILQAGGVVVGIWRSKAHKAGAVIQLVSSAVLLEPRHTVGHRILEQVLNVSVPRGEEGQEDIQHQEQI